MRRLIAAGAVAMIVTGCAARTGLTKAPEATVNRTGYLSGQVGLLDESDGDCSLVLLTKDNQQIRPPLDREVCEAAARWEAIDRAARASQPKPKPDTKTAPDIED